MEKGSSSFSSSSAAANNSGPDSLNGLKFGKKIYYEGHVGSGLMKPKASGGPAPLPPSPSKRRRAGFLQGGQPPRCKVEGCKVDLSDAKAYYFRHKVCGMHSKSAKVIVAGLEQRFCQQCSRFHLLPEFDDGKRSCRRRLAGHNERRRKPQQRSLLSPCYGTLFSSVYDNNHVSKTGGLMMDFSNHTPPSHTGRNSFTYSAPERGGLTTNQTVMSAKFQFPMLSHPQTPPLDLLTSRPSYSCPVASESFSGTPDSNSALSLLSNQAWATPKGRIGMNSIFCENPGPAASQFICPSWGFKGNEGNGPNGGLHMMPPDLGLSQAPNSGYNGGLGVDQPSEEFFHELDQSRAYDSSIQHARWSP